MNIILLRGGEISGEGRVTLSDRRARHMIGVLKCQPGQSVRMGILNGPPGSGTVDAVDGPSVTLSWAPSDQPPPEPRVDLLLALPRPKVMKRLWAPLASLGVGRIVVTQAAKVERTYFETHWIEPESYEPLLMEGLEQAGATGLPEVLVRRRFKPLVEDELDELFPSGVRIIAQPGEGGVPGCVRGAARAVLAIGPEGGWTQFEEGLLQEEGFVPIGLGWRTLRSDTACIALLAVVKQAMAGG
jgi:16S rRNA (uracil1498-N3)-methyltransferase